MLLLSSPHVVTGGTVVPLVSSESRKFVFLSSIYENSMFLLVGWYVGWFVRLLRADGKTDQDGLYVERTVAATELTWWGLYPDPATSWGHKRGQKLPLKI